MFISKKNKIIPQMFDIRPVDKNGFLDVSKIGKNKKIIEVFPLHNYSNRSNNLLRSLH